MKKYFMIGLCTISIFILTGCRSEVDLIGSWVSSDNSTYQFNSDGTCEKRTNIDIYTCTYSKANGVVDIELSNGTKESGQINPDRIIIGSDVYKKGE